MKIKDPNRLKIDITRAVAAKGIKPTAENIADQLPVSYRTYFRMVNAKGGKSAPKFDLSSVLGVADYIGVDVYDIAENAN